MSKARQAKAAMRSERTRAQNSGRYNPAERKEVRGMQCEGLVSNLGQLLLQAGVVPDEVRSKVPEEDVKLPSRELPTGHTIFKLNVMINRKWEVIAMIYDRAFALMLATAFREQFKLDVQVVDHLNENEIVRLTNTVDQYRKIAANILKESRRLEQLESRRQDFVEKQSKGAAPTKVMGRKTAVLVEATGSSGRILKSDYEIAIKKMKPEAVTEGMKLPAVRSLYERLYKQCSVAPTLRKKPRKQAVRPAKKVLKKAVVIRRRTRAK